MNIFAGKLQQLFIFQGKNVVSEGSKGIKISKTFKRCSKYIVGTMPDLYSAAIKNNNNFDNNNTATYFLWVSQIIGIIIFLNV